MNNIPNLPTDSLYKFVCVSGLVLAVVSYISFINSEKSIRESIAQSNSDVSVLSTKIRLLKEGSSAIQPNDYDAKNKAQNIQVELKSLEISLAEILSKDEAIKYELKRFEEDAEFDKKNMQYGFFFTVLGFVAWYFKLQRHIDNIIKKQAN